MFCLRSWLPLLFLPLNSPPIFIICFFILNYLANRPCLYCSLLLVLLFASSCAWADACFLDLTSNWFEAPKRNPGTVANYTDGGNATQSTVFLAEVVSSTAVALANSAVSQLKDVVASAPAKSVGAWTVTEWFRNLSTRGVRIPCVDVIVRL